MRIGFAGLSIPFLSSCSSVSLGLQNDGTYILENNEKSLDCDRLYKAIWGRVQSMKTMPARAKVEQEQLPPTAFLAIGRIFGGRDALRHVVFPLVQRRPPVIAHEERTAVLHGRNRAGAGVVTHDLHPAETIGFGAVGLRTEASVRAGADRDPGARRFRATRQRHQIVIRQDFMTAGREGANLAVGALGVDRSDHRERAVSQRHGLILR